ncbi:MAG: lipoprotein-releasing system transmembrane subunit LolC [Porticoccaceae bacterium]|nr:lipoprotein-releasing system transmembrane subunit LolC [Porticoccaceae bacterium]
MLRTVYLFVGLRYILSIRRKGYLTFTSFFSIIAMILGVTALITVMSVMNGFDQEIKGRLLQVIPHITVQPPTFYSEIEYRSVLHRLVDMDGIETVVPLAQSDVMLSFKGRQLGVRLRGVNPKEKFSFDFQDNIVFGDLENFKEGKFHILVGSQVARKLGLFVGDKVQITLPQINITPIGIFPRFKSSVVAGIYQVGAQVDASSSIMHRKDLLTLLNQNDGYSGLQIHLADPFTVASQIKTMTPLFSDDTVWRSWQDEMGSFFEAMKMEKRVMSLLLSVIVAVAAFNIVASLTLMVSTKRSDIAVLRAFGASPATIMKIFLVQGIVVGSIGILLGILFGCLLSKNIGLLLTNLETLMDMHLFDPSVYLINVLPSKILISDVLLVASTAFLLCISASLYPAWQASRIVPSEALRHEL